MSGSLRFRALLDRWFAVAVVLFVVVALLGGWLAYQGHVAPGTTTEQRTVSTWNTTGSVNHSAVVDSENPVYPVGTTLENRRIYFLNVSRVLDGTVAFSYAASDGGALNVTTTRRTTLRSVEENRGETVEVWERRIDVENRSSERVGPGETVTVPFSVDASRMKNRTERVDEELDGPPGEPRLVVNTTFDLSGTVNGREVNRTEVVVLSMTFEGNGYRVTSNGTGGAFETTRSVEVPQEAGPLRTVGGPLLLLVGLAGLGALGWVRRQHPGGLTDAERERLTFEDDREDFDEWISVIELPDEVLDRPRASADSLGSLVDFAIDTDNGVVEDPSRELYCVLHDGYLYSYEPPEPESRPEGPAVESAQTATEEMDGSGTEEDENHPV